jgi:uracil-DNA glycosylase
MMPRQARELSSRSLVLWIIDLARVDGAFVAGEGPQNAGIMLIGQNPGAEEAKQCRVFVGKSGKYLDSVLRKNNIDRSKLYVTSVVKETTPGNRRPTAREIRYWMSYLVEEIRQVRPKTVVLMGEVAWKTQYSGCSNRNPPAKERHRGRPY